MGWFLLSKILAEDPRSKEEKERLIAAASSLPTAREINDRFSWSQEAVDENDDSQGQEQKIEKSHRRFNLAFGGGNYEFGLGIPAILGWPLTKDGQGNFTDARTAVWHAKCTDENVGIPRWIKRTIRRIVLQSLSGDTNEHANPKPMRLLVSWEEDPAEPDHWRLEISYGGRGPARRYCRLRLIGPGLDVDRPSK